jgi:drug/metabolite transporter (DMT)-like permease
VFLGAEQAGTWPFITIASLVGGGLQLLARAIYPGDLKTAVQLPWRLWVGPVFCFVLYGLAWPFALASSNTRQVIGISLINYLWPVLTVLFSVWLVPGVHLSRKIVAALVLALAGLALANFHQIEALLAGTGSQGSTIPHFLPYILALVAALTWAVYSALLARWQAWSRPYITSPVGFIIIGLCGGLVMLATGTLPRRLTGLGTLMTVCYGVGPLAGGYLLWELALARARVQTLSLIAAMTPVLSTLFLCCCLRRMPGLELIGAAVLVGGAVVLSIRE